MTIISQRACPKCGSKEFITSGKFNLTITECMVCGYEEKQHKDHMESKNKWQ